MNCPQCEQPIGQDQHYIGPWVPVKDDRYRVIGSLREIVIHCDHCGTFTARQDGRHFVQSVTHHTSKKEVARVERKLASRTLEKVPA